MQEYIIPQGMETHTLSEVTGIIPKSYELTLETSVWLNPHVLGANGRTGNPPN